MKARFLKKICIHFIVIISLIITTPLLLAITVNAQFQKTTKLMSGIGTLQKLMLHLESRVSPATHQFLRKKLKGYEDTPFEIKPIGVNEIQISSPRVSVPVKWINDDNSGLISLAINHRKITLDPQKPIEVLWSQIQAILPAPRYSGIWDLFLTEAHATEPIAMTVIANGVAIIGLVYVLHHLQEVSQKRDKCWISLPNRRPAHEVKRNRRICE